ncbi:MAG: membrane-targeted effector domain-containing toxin, partial [Gammaproteobacteria bacterium]|nr:membrane-targeted effector domain-containing toxin [Gammaproteobacteria bacterium]
MEEKSKKAPFNVAYEVYRDPRTEVRVARQKRGITRALNFNEDDPAPKILFFANNNARAKTLPDSHEPQCDNEKKQYNLLKHYFEDKKNLLDLRNPLIFYDDNAMRVDIGYGPKEFPILFPELLRQGKLNDESYAKTQKAIVFRGDYSSELHHKRERLLEMAEQAKKNPLPQKPNIALDNQLTTEDAFIENLFTAHRGFVIGEIHEHSSPKRFLIEHMKKLAELGVTRIYMEHLLDRHQSLLDEKTLPQELALYLTDLDKGHDVKDYHEGNDEWAGTFLNVVKAAKKHGIQIIAIDSEATYAIGGAKSYSDLLDEDSDTVMRYQLMNTAMLERFQQYDDKGKYLVFVGSGHASTSRNVTGVSELLGCPSVIIHDKDEENAAAILKSDVDYEKGTKDATHYDFLYYRDDKSKTF